MIFGVDVPCHCVATGGSSGVEPTPSFDDASEGGFGGVPASSGAFLMSSTLSIDFCAVENALRAKLKLESSQLIVTFRLLLKLLHN